MITTFFTFKHRHFLIERVFYQNITSDQGRKNEQYGFPIIANEEQHSFQAQAINQQRRSPDEPDKPKQVVVHVPVQVVTREGVSGNADGI